MPQFEGLAKARLKVLHMFERMSNGERAVGRDLEPAGKRKCIEELRSNGLWLSYPQFDDDVSSFAHQKERFLFADTVSHYILRLAFCKTRESRDWFLKQESRLFALRLQHLKEQAVAKFYSDTGNAHVKYAGSGLKELQECTPGAKIFTAGSTGPPQYESEFYEIPWTDITPFMIARRRVVLRKGFAYVPNSLLFTIVVDKFKTSVRSSLEQAMQGIDIAMQEKRISPFLRTLQENGQTLFFARAQNVQIGPSEKLSLVNFETLLKRSLPPCMRWTVEAQRDQKKRLKHQGKLQLRPFLREAGFDLKQSLSWWRQEVTRDPEVDESKFEKNFAYDIEHAYGKKGHMKGQNAFGCASVIGFPLATAGQVHGCPFKSMDRDMLKTVLKHWSVPTGDIEDITRKAGDKHYQLACKDFFCKTHPGHTGDGIGNHPNHFFNESVSFYNGGSTGQGGAKASSPRDPAQAAAVPMEITD